MRGRRRRTIPCRTPIPGPLDDDLRLHHVQVKSTHNSYHVEAEGNPVEAWAYTMPPLDEQLDLYGVRHFELDVYHEPDEDVFEVFHLPFADEQTNCETLVDCLGAMARWSDRHRAHAPIVVSIEPKNAAWDDPEPYFEALHQRIESVWPRPCIITPDEVQAEEPTLADGLRARGWPTLRTLRGRVLFVLLDGGAWRDAYTRMGSDLRDRLLFAEGSAADSWAAVARLDDPVAASAAIADATAAGLLVRTRADTDGVEVRAGDRTRLEAALASGAHLVSTDFPAPTDAYGEWLVLPGGTPARCNPVTAPQECTSEAIEDPGRL